MQHGEAGDGDLAVGTCLRQRDHVPRWVWNGRRHHRRFAVQQGSSVRAATTRASGRHTDT